MLSVFYRILHGGVIISLWADPVGDLLRAS